MGLDEGGGRAEARTVALALAEADAVRGLRLVRCPKCGRADESARLWTGLRYWYRGLVAICGGLVALGVLVMVATPLGVDFQDGILAWAVRVGAVFVILGAGPGTVVFLHRRRLAEIDKATLAGAPD